MEISELIASEKLKKTTANKANSLAELYRRMEMAEKRVSEFGGRSIEIMQSQQQRELWKKKKKPKNRDLKDSTERFNNHTIRVPEREQKECSKE